MPISHSPETDHQIAFMTSNGASMSKTYTQLIKQIESLSREAETLKQKEVEGVVARIKEAIQTYGLSAADLGLAATRAPGRKSRGTGNKKSAKSSGGASPRFRDESGNTWVGRGPRPQWLRDALAGGKQLQDFAI